MSSSFQRPDQPQLYAERTAKPPRPLTTKGPRVPKAKSNRGKYGQRGLAPVLMNSSPDNMNLTEQRHIKNTDLDIIKEQAKPENTMSGAEERTRKIYASSRQFQRNFSAKTHGRDCEKYSLAEPELPYRVIRTKEELEEHRQHIEALAKPRKPARVEEPPLRESKDFRVRNSLKAGLGQTQRRERQG